MQLAYFSQSNALRQRLSTFYLISCFPHPCFYRSWPAANCLFRAGILKALSHSAVFPISVIYLARSTAGRHKIIASLRSLYPMRECSRHRTLGARIPPLSINSREVVTSIPFFTSLWGMAGCNCLLRHRKMRRSRFLRVLVGLLCFPCQFLRWHTLSRC